MLGGAVLRSCFPPPFFPPPIFGCFLGVSGAFGVFLPLLSLGAPGGGGRSHCGLLRCARRWVVWGSRWVSGPGGTRWGAAGRRLGRGGGGGGPGLRARCCPRRLFDSVKLFPSRPPPLHPPSAAAHVRGVQGRCRGVQQGKAEVVWEGGARGFSPKPSKFGTTRKRAMPRARSRARGRRGRAERDMGAPPHTTATAAPPAPHPNPGPPPRAGGALEGQR